MTITSLAAMAGLVLAIANLVGLIYIVGWRIGRLDLKTEMMWKYVFEEAFLDARRRGVVAAQSPLRLDPAIAQQFQANGLSVKLLDLNRRDLRQRSDSEVTWEFFRHFQRELLDQICLPLGLNMGAALVAALQLCREADKDLDRHA